MNNQEFQPNQKVYTAPLCKTIELSQTLSILESLSTEGHIEDFVDGDDI